MKFLATLIYWPAVCIVYWPAVCIGTLLFKIAYIIAENIIDPLNEKYNID